MRLLLHVVLTVLSFLLAFSPLQSQEEQQDFYVRASVTNDTPFLGERILYSFQFLSYVPASNVSDQLPDFAGFWVGDTYSPSGSQVEVINGRQYVVSEILVELSPLREGQIVIESARLHIAESVFRAGVSLSTEPIIIQVMPLPPGAPEAFNGGVGQFNAQIELDKSTVTLGEPVKLTITVDGTGNLEQLPAPPLPELERWRIYRNPARYFVRGIGGLRFGQKIFEWLLVPESTGSRIIPEIVFASFDPQIEQYQTVIFPSFTVEVFPGEGNASELFSFRRTEQGRTPLVLKSVPERISLADSSVSAQSWFLWVIAPFAMLVSAMILVSSRIYRVRRVQYQTSAASSKAIARLKRAATLPTSQASEEAVSAVMNYFAHKHGTDINQLRGQGIVTLLNAHNIPPALIEQLMKHLNEIEGVQYIPNNTLIDVRPLLQRLAASLLEIDKGW